MPKDQESYSKEEAAQRRDDALRRALMTPPKPHKVTPKKERGIKARTEPGRGQRAPKP